MQNCKYTNDENVKNLLFELERVSGAKEKMLIRCFNSTIDVDYRIDANEEAVRPVTLFSF